MRDLPTHLLPLFEDTISQPLPDYRQEEPSAGFVVNRAPASGARPEDIYEVLVQCRKDRVPCALCTVIDSAGSSPRKAGAHMIVLANGDIIGTIGGGAIEQETILAARAAIQSGEPRVLERHLTHDLGMCCGGRMKLFIEPQTYPLALWIFGAGHVAQPLCEVATIAGFEVTVIDERPQQATPERFPCARHLICEPPLWALDHNPRLVRVNAPQTFVVIVTHDHALDEAILARLLPLSLPYLGVIGSVRKREKFKQRLRVAGFSDDALAALRTPMGLDIGAVTPQEIAVSVAAELVLVRRAHGDGAPMRNLGQKPKP